MSTPYGAGPSPEEIAKAFAFDPRLSAHMDPVPDIPGLEDEVTEWREARDEWRDITRTLEDIPGQIRHAQAQDATKLRDAVLAGKVGAGSLTPNVDKLMRDLSEARVRVDGAKTRFSDAIFHLRGAIGRNKADVLSALEQRTEELSELAAPYVRAVNAIHEHRDHAARVERFVRGSDLEGWTGRPVGSLPKLPKPLTKESA